MPDPGYRIIPLDGFEILVGKSARENDELSLKIARPRDFWLHAHGFAGSHVVVRPAASPEGGRVGASAADPSNAGSSDRSRPPAGDVPRSVLQRAAELAAWHSKARNARGKVAVHLCRAEDVSKPRGAPAGQVRLRHWEVLKAYPKE
jgi:predicted ribosome quality control (RQC) complex YloA/Tae2 family protein